MRGRNLLAGVLVVVSMASALLVAKNVETQSSALKMVAACEAFLSGLTPEQRKQATFAYDDAERTNWHFIPRPRKGLPLKALEGPPLAAAQAFIASGLSTAGYEQALNIMSLEEVLFLLEGGDRKVRRERRDPTNYFLSVFGEPSAKGRWGWRVEGHHLSLNYTVQDGAVVASTPEFFGANPGTIEAGPGREIRLLGVEEDLGRQILKSCTAEQRAAMYVDAKPPGEIRDAATKQPSPAPPVGLAAAKMSDDQRAVLRRLLAEYLQNMPADIRGEREKRIESGGFDKIQFAWWGGTERNQPHHYRIEGPTFVIEYNNTQNNANHVHSVWRNLGGDFNLPRDAK